MTPNPNECMWATAGNHPCNPNFKKMKLHHLFLSVLGAAALLLSTASATEIYSGEPLNEALHDLEKAATRVSHALSSASPTFRTDVFRLADGRLVAVSSRATKPGQPYSVETLRVTASATSTLTKRLPKISSLTLPW